MSNFDPATSTKLPKDKLNYVLTYPKSIFFADVETLTALNGSQYYKINYDNETNINFSYEKLVPANYTAKYIYIFGLLHNNVTGLTDTDQSKIVGELVVECTNTQNSSKAYICFFLQTNNTNPAVAPSNPLDDIIAMKMNGSPAKISNFILNSIIPQQINAGSFIYKDTMNPTNTVVLFLNPIIISPATSSTVSVLLSSDGDGDTPLFSIRAPLVQEQSNNISNQPSADDENIYIDCNPSGESNETIQTYNLPIKSDLLGNKNQMDVMKTSLNFFMFMFLVLIVYIAVPKLYKKIVIDGANKFFKENSGVITSPLIRIRSIDMWLSFIIIFTCYILFKDGFEGDKFDSLSTGMYLVLIFGLSVILIQSYKANEQDYMKTIYGSCGKIGENYILSKDGWEYTSLSDFFRTLSDGCVFYVKDVLKVHVALFTVVVAFVSISNAIQKKPFGKEFGLILGNWAFIMLPISFIVRTFM